MIVPQILILSAAAFAAIKADRNHGLRVREDFFVGWIKPFAFGKKVPDYSGIRICIVNRGLWLMKTPDGEKPFADGATGFLDKTGGVDYAEAHVPHDYLYGDLDKLATDPAWLEAGWTYDEIRRLMDAVLGVMAKYKAAQHKTRLGRAYGKCVAYLLHGFSRTVGDFFHQLYKVKLCFFITVCAWLAGCACYDIPDVFTPSGEELKYDTERLLCGGVP